ncbi:hypothetical protein PISMIDRAFT_12225 [Pisolithus microcarpus 441]|uniref:HAT C-terminal dimerisation domain-containing protein n=1 Tax=Pisolithus microcarpus 441 TaxID=765257 RepID=A0A0C9ZPB8_9AGAM|nr:hypothetical protein PISMIDRAFT_12225 [Pisolithus microcarpus 441]
MGQHAHEALLQMKEYRVHVVGTNSAVDAPEAPHAVEPCKKACNQRSLAARYGITTSESGGHPIAKTVRTIQEELDGYLTTEVQEGTDPIHFWQASRTLYPTLFHIAMDYLLIQASSVPCECAFSSSGETMTKRQNRISMVLMEALQMTKFFLKKECLDFMAGWVTSQHDMQQEINGDILAKAVDTHLSREDLTQVVDDIMVAIAGDEGNGVEL